MQIEGKRQVEETGGRDKLRFITLRKNRLEYFNFQGTTNPQQVSAIDGRAGAAPFIDEINLVQPLFQKSTLLLLQQKQG